MGFNLLEVLGDQVTGVLAKEASGFLGGSESGITKALGISFPAILGSVMNKGASESGAGELLDLIKGQDVGFMDNVAGLFGGGGGALETLMGSGGGILKMLMGDKIGGVVDIVAKAAGLDQGMTGKLIKMAAPFLIGTIGKQVMKNGLNVGGLMDLLSGQKEHLAKSAMPSELGDMLGLGGLLKGIGNIAGDGLDAGKKVVGGAANLGKSAVGTAANVGSAAVDTATKTGSSLLKWLLPAILVLGLLSYFFGFRTGCNAVDNVTDAAVNTTKTVANKTAHGVKAVGNAAGDAAGAVTGAFGAMFSKVDAAAKKALDALKFESGTAAANFKSFIEGGAKGSGVFRFKDLHFATGSSAIGAKAGGDVDNIAAILKAYPGVKVQIAGHTDKTGNAEANMKLSQARAEVVKGRLIAKGISGSRLSAKGYGSTQPVSASATNAENRRIEVRLVH